MRLNADKTGYTMTLPAPGVYAQMQSNMAATLNIDWVLGLAAGILASQGITRIHGRDARAGRRMDRRHPRRRSLLYQPYISEAGERGPFVDAYARAGFIGSRRRHGYADLVRAVFEGLGLRRARLLRGDGRRCPARCG